MKTVANRSDEHIYDEVKRLKRIGKVIQERDLLKGHSVLCKGNFVKYAWI
nr:hypothetical protein [sulfur-oxidizing endosymbiont of Gigantopelta aegis]